MKKIAVATLSLLLCLFLVNTVQAVTVPVTLTIDDVSPTVNPYAVNGGDTFAWTVEYDRTKITGVGDEFLTPGFDPPSIQISATVGTYTFKASDAFFYPFGPAVLFKDGAVTGFFMFTVLDSNLPGYAHQMGYDQYLLVDSAVYSEELNNYTYSGHFTFFNPVPEPGSALLLLSSLIGFGGLGRLFRD